MKTSIKRKSIQIGENSVEFYHYYFAIWNDDIGYRECLKNVVRQFAEVLKGLGTEYQAAYLPYIPDDQGSWCLKATLVDDKVIMKKVEIGFDGWAMSFDNVKELSETDQEILNEKEGIWGVYDQGELIESLGKAEIVDDDEGIKPEDYWQVSEE
ncbi:MAG TPA: hypothetical protein VFD58_03170 [Blastocatellia bacterium]|nr:hypothetical protein [Blastocatellia bacterium]